jgi:bifunctional non-homologous end joining protein LigD
VSHRNLENIARAADKTWHSNRSSAKTARRAPATASRPATPARADREGIPGARSGKLPDFVEPQLATLVAAAPAATSGSTR